MQITKIESFLLKDQLKEAFFFSQWAYKERQICIVKITTDSGIYGWGEGYGPATVLQEGIKLLSPMLNWSKPLRKREALV